MYVVDARHDSVVVCTYNDVHTPPHPDAFFMRCVAISHDASMHIRGRIVTERTGTDEKRIRVGRA